MSVSSATQQGKCKWLGDYSVSKPSQSRCWQNSILKEAGSLAFLGKVMTTNQEAKREETFSREKLAKEKGKLKFPCSTGRQQSQVYSQEEKASTIWQQLLYWTMGKENAAVFTHYLLKSTLLNNKILQFHNNTLHTHIGDSTKRLTLSPLCTAVPVTQPLKVCFLFPLSFPSPEIHFF